MVTHARYFNRKLARVQSAEEAQTKRESTHRDTRDRESTECPVLLELNCDRWIKTTSQRTQIIYRADASIIVYHMALLHTARVIESGTGTLGLTYVLSKYLRAGTVDTVECNADRYTAAKKEIEKVGLNNVRIHCSRVLEYLQSVVESKERADGLVLDVPEPDEVLQTAEDALRPGSAVCCFVPCIEQVQRVLKKAEELPRLKVEKLLENIEIAHKPALISTEPAREYGTTQDTQIRGHTGYIILMRTLP
ncbi:tRNA (adenine57-N1/adenine58-N1)-methyltransferase catalytic subunit [Nematocida minor]|uniref:tRNA (adenine57-N1/adenine58-N1)-methyltransferase catalytic subunit n=1 Tax=Nematocida minor TaxID=1912983 RepID=UPI00221F7BB6|nr:tRNA (adenine57-N1/adenine58-N1)-methyltransferase catalytic subunit [Nematocida minor]KAI5190228.1 tRNA (adenine57-N1/adenine58-N1)-methyltransferase catalytic subunit [Nematocida minor]